MNDCPRFMQMAGLALALCALMGEALALSPGARVPGKWSNGWWYAARVTAVNGQSIYLKFDDGDTLVVEPQGVAALDWAVGTTLQCKWQGAGNWYPARITTLNHTEMIVAYGNGATEYTAPRNCRTNVANALQPAARGPTYYDAVITAIAGNAMVVRYRIGSQEQTRLDRCRSGKIVARSGNSASGNGMPNESSRDVPGDPAELARVIERNRGAQNQGASSPGTPRQATSKEDAALGKILKGLDELLE